MIPTYKNNLLKSYENTNPEPPQPVYKIDWENNRLLSQKIEDHEAVSQNIRVITAVEYQDFVAMPDWFGLAMKNMYGMPPKFVKANLERLVKEALSTYLLIEKIYDVDIYDIDKHSIGIDLTIQLRDGTSFRDTLEVPFNV